MKIPVSIKEPYFKIEKKNKKYQAVKVFVPSGGAVMLSFYCRNNTLEFG